eukprot:8716-Heterococcus_DN1.PRE.1
MHAINASYLGAGARRAGAEPRAAQHVKRRGAFHAVCSSEVSVRRANEKKVKQGRVRFCASKDPKASRRERCRVEQTQRCNA